MAAFPGPVVLLSAEGRVLQANQSSERLVSYLSSHSGTRLTTLVRGAVGDRRARSGTITLPGDPRASVLELMLVPIGAEACIDKSLVLLIGRDVTLERNLRSALIDSRERYKGFVEVSSDFSWETGADGKLTFVSPGGALGYRPAELVGRQARSLLAEDDVHQGDAEGDLPFAAVEPVRDIELWLRRADGSPACVVVAAVPVHGADGHWRGARGVCRDVTLSRRRDTALARALNRERLIGYIVRTMADAITPQEVLPAAALATIRALPATGCSVHRLDGEDTLVGVASAGELPGPAVIQQLVDRARSDPESVVTSAAPHRAFAIATRYHQAVNGVLCLWWGKTVPAEAPAGDAAVREDEEVLMTAVADQLGIALQQLADHEEMARLSSTDGLTDLFNRRTFFAVLAQRLSVCDREQRSGALVYVDLDNFKPVNDQHGHQRGDNVLRRVAGLLTGTCRAGDLSARLGGDEFALWLEGCNEATAAARAEDLLAASAVLRGDSGSPDRPLGFSLGIAIYQGDHPEELEALTARADAAMYLVKHGGKGGYEVAPSPESAGTATLDVVAGGGSASP